MLAVLTRNANQYIRETQLVDPEAGDLYVGNTTEKSERMVSGTNSTKVASLLLLCATACNALLTEPRPVPVFISLAAVTFAGVTLLLTWPLLWSCFSFEEDVDMLQRIRPGSILSAGLAILLIFISSQSRQRNFLAAGPNHRPKGFAQRRAEALLIARTNQFGVEAEMAKSRNVELIPKPLKRLTDAHNAAQNFEKMKQSAFEDEVKRYLEKDFDGPGKTGGKRNARRNQNASEQGKAFGLYVAGADPDVMPPNGHAVRAVEGRQSRVPKTVLGQHLTVENEGGDRGD